MSAPVICTVGCTEPWNAAGLGLDIRALSACGARPVSVVAGVTAQARAGVRAAVAVPAGVIAAQFAALADAGIAAYRIGALLDEASVDAVAAQVAGSPLPVVYDPVLAPSGGGNFADDAVVRAIVARLLPHVTLVTPNLAEAGRLGSVVSPQDVGAMRECARDLLIAGARAALIKGGHLRAEPVDLLVDTNGSCTFEGSRLPGELRGTGCLLADAIAVALARGACLRDAVETGRSFVRERFTSARSFGGMRVAY